MSVGCSDASPEKWRRFGYLLGAHMAATKKIIERERWANRKYQYIDLYAGPGLYTAAHHPKLAGMIGSPILALDAAAAVDLACDFHFVEPDVHADLEAAVATHPKAVGRRIYKTDCCDAVGPLFQAIPPASFGLLFVDPNGKPDWGAVRALARRYQKIDVLINVNATIHKRCRLSSRDPQTATTCDHLRDVSSAGKPQIMLWAPEKSDCHQFTLAYLTNGPTFEAKRQGFHPITSPEGRRIARRIDLSEKERRELGPDPGFLPGFGDVA